MLEKERAVIRDVEHLSHLFGHCSGRKDRETVQRIVREDGDVLVLVEHLDEGPYLLADGSNHFGLAAPLQSAERHADAGRSGGHGRQENERHRLFLLSRL